MKFDLSTLNPEQLKPVLDTEGAVLVTAGAGSGKTRLLTHRIAYIIDRGMAARYNILAITFTNKAAGEMKERLCDMVENADDIWIFTFHALCVRILRRYIGFFPGFTPNFSIYGENEKNNCIKRILRELADNGKIKAAADFEKIAAAAAGVAAGVAGAEALGKAGSLFDEIAPKAVETLTGANINEEKKQIDKFYTFNRKKEEFQKLLDKEYERIENKLEPGGFEEDIAGFMDVERGTAVEGTTQLEEMVKARTLFFDDPFFVPEDDKEEKEEEQAVAEALADDEGGIPAEELEGTKSKVVFEPQAEESLADVLAEQEKAEDLDKAAEEEASPVETEAKADEDKKPSEEKIEEATEAEKEEAKEVKGAESEEESVEKEDKEDKSDEAARIVIEPNVKPEEKDDDTEKLAREFFESDDEDEKKKMGKGSKILIWILSIIIVITAALLVVRIALPDTVISRQMDNIAYKVVSLFTGEDEDADASAERDSLVEDKTGLIQLQIDKNYKDGIATIKYNADAAYDENKDYAKDTGLNDAKDIQSNLWYTDDSDNSHYYDEELVGAVIAFESQRLALINDADNKVMSMVEKSSSIEDQLKEEAGSDKDIDFSQLEIGDIKVAGNSYFVWVNETIDGKQSQKIYEFREKDKSLVVRAAYDA